MKLSFHFMLLKAFHAERRQIRKDMERYELSPGQPKVLRYIAAHEHCMLKDIAVACDVECATVSKIMNALEEKGMLTRQTAQHNKRALCLSITPKGNHALQQWNKHCEEVEQRSLQGFSEAEKKQFADFLKRMYENLNGKEME